MDEIARSLGMSKRTIYENFEDKNSLIEACLKENTTNGIKKMEQILNSTPNVYEAMFQYAQFKHGELKETNPVLFDDLRKYYAPIMEKVKSENQKYTHANLHKMFSKGINEGYFFNQINTDIACLMLEEFCIFSIQLVDNYKYPMKDVAYTVFLSFFRGISTGKGIKAMESIEKRLF